MPPKARPSNSWDAALKNRRGSPAVERATRVLEFLGSNPGRSFTMSELARGVGLSKATCHALLATLEGRGYVRRNVGLRTYSLGPAPVPLGAVAISGSPALAAAREAIAELAARLNVLCNISFATSDDIVILAQSGANTPGAPSSKPNDRLPLAPPWGAIFVAWGSPELVRLWLSRVEDGPPGAAEAWDTMLQTVRERGYVAVARTPARDAYLSLAHDPSWSATQKTKERTLEALRLVQRETEQTIDTPLEEVGELQLISVPVFGPEADVELGLTIQLPRGTTGANVQSFVAELQIAAQDATGIHARHPDVSTLAIS